MNCAIEHRKPALSSERLKSGGRCHRSLEHRLPGACHQRAPRGWSIGQGFAPDPPIALGLGAYQISPATMSGTPINESRKVAFGPCGRPKTRFHICLRHSLRLNVLYCPFRALTPNRCVACSGTSLTISSRGRLAGFNPVSKSLAKHADRTEFHRSGKLITATRANALRLRFHGLTALQPQSELKTTPRSTEWCESGQQGPWQTVVPFHKLVCSIICAAISNRNDKHQTSRDIRRHDILNRTRIQKILDRLKGTLDKSAALILPIF